jgi:hypothetical protein
LASLSSLASLSLASTPAAAMLLVVRTCEITRLLDRRDLTGTLCLDHCLVVQQKSRAIEGGQVGTTALASQAFEDLAVQRSGRAIATSLTLSVALSVGLPVTLPMALPVTLPLCLLMTSHSIIGHVFL